MKEMLRELEELVKEFGEKSGLRASFSRMLSILMDYPCMLRCWVELEPRPQSQPIDAYYLERHEFVRKLLPDTLKL